MFSVKTTIYIVVSLCYLLNNTSAQVAEGTPCETPEKEYGLCLNIKSCTYAINLLRTARGNSQVTSYLRSLTCGYAGNTPMVCCPQKQQQQVTTSSPATRNTNGGTIRGTTTTSTPTNQPSTSSFQLPKSPNCGLSNLTTPRVVNGIPAKLGEFPWMVALGYRNSKNPSTPKWLCGGTLITDRHILTAAHCVYNRNDLYLARVGELDLYTDDDHANPQDIPLVKAKIHEEFNSVSYVNDIAILTMAEKSSRDSVWPICLPLEEPIRSKNYLNFQLVVAGWGALYFKGPSSSILQLTTLPVLKNDNCERAYGNQTKIDDRILCAGHLQGGKDACQGDSGGPLMYGVAEPYNIRYYQMGVVSYGFRCAEAGYPGVYTRITKFLDWIQRNLN